MEDKSLWLLSINSAAEIVAGEAGSCSSPLQRRLELSGLVSQEASLLLLLLYKATILHYSPSSLPSALRLWSNDAVTLLCRDTQSVQVPAAVGFSHPRH